jgi:uncharacterized protein YecA (UPF0149 family)
MDCANERIIVIGDDMPQEILNNFLHDVPFAKPLETEYFIISPIVIPPPKVQTARRPHPKVGRNEPCTCGSGKKFKKCHLLKAVSGQAGITT